MAPSLTKPGRRRRRPGIVRRTAEAVGVLTALTAALWGGLPFLEPQSECITASWCISSHDEPLTYAMLFVISLVLGLTAMAVGGSVALWMLRHRHARALYGAFFGGLAAFGGGVWCAVVPAEERLETLHVPILACLLALAGAALIRSWWRSPPAGSPESSGRDSS